MDLRRILRPFRSREAIGSYPFFREGRTGANFVVRSPDAALADTCIADLSATLTATGRTVIADGI